MLRVRYVPDLLGGGSPPGRLFAGERDPCPRWRRVSRSVVKITNTGVAPLSYFADGRLDTVGDVRLAELSGQNTDIALPVPVGVYPYWLIPPDFSQLTVAASGTQPVNLDVGYNSGGPDVYSAAQGNTALVQHNAAELSTGLWFANIGQTGPFAEPAQTRRRDRPRPAVRPGRDVVDRRRPADRGGSGGQSGDGIRGAGPAAALAALAVSGADHAGSGAERHHHRDDYADRPRRQRGAGPPVRRHAQPGHLQR